MSGFSRTSAHRFLIVRLGSLGDIIHAVPAAAALRAAFPTARIDWLTDPAYLELLGLVDGIDNRIAIDTRALMSGSHAVLGTIARLRQERYDAAIDMQGLLKSAVVARASGARRVVGFSREHLRELAARLFYTATIDPAGAVHVIHKNLGLLRGLDVRDETIRFPLSIPPSPVIDTFVARFGAERFLLLNPAAAWPNKRWSPGRFGEVAAAVRARHGLRSVVMWGPREEALASAVVAASSGAAALAPATRMPDIFALARGARLMISGDTGPMHMAAAVGTPVIGLFGPTRAERNGPWAADDVVISRLENCECVYERKCRRSNMCINDISVHEVTQAVERRFATRNRV